MNLEPKVTARRIFLGIACVVWIAGACANESPPADAQEGAEGGDAAVASRSTSSPAPDVDPCTLLTAAEIEEVVGTATGSAKPSDLGVPECSWDPAEGAGPPLASVMVHYGPTPGNTFEEYVDYHLETLGDLTSRDTYNEVEGVGDYGVWMGRDEDGVLEVYEDDLSITVSTVAGGGQTARENAIELAKRVRARLP